MTSWYSKHMSLDNPQKVTELEYEFARIHASLKIDSGALAADAVLNLLHAK